MRRLQVTLAGAFLFAGLCTASGADWVRSGLNGERHAVWGLKGGLQFGIYPAVIAGYGGPRGLIRVAGPFRDDGKAQFVNYISVEPYNSHGHSFCETDVSPLDGVRGMRMWASEVSDALQPEGTAEPGTVTDLGGGVERLDVTLRIETFRNGARVRVRVSMRSDDPDELHFTVHTESGSAPLAKCVLTATWGNFTRNRLLYLKDQVVSSLDLYKGLKGNGFTYTNPYPIGDITITPGGDALAAETTNEADPSAVWPVPGRNAWYYGGHKVTQYWRVPAGQYDQTLSVVVNGRAEYWASHTAIPGGPAFENFEFRESFVEGQHFVYGITEKTPEELGLR